MPIRYQAVYAGTKAYNYNFSESLAHEFPDKIDVLVMTPGAMDTNLGPHLKPLTATRMVTAEYAAKKMIDNLGYETHTFGAEKHENYMN